jgi:hypothetical protein
MWRKADMQTFNEHSGMWIDRIVDAMQFLGTHLVHKLSFFLGNVVWKDDGRMKLQAAFFAEWKGLCYEHTGILDRGGKLVSRRSIADPKAWNRQTPLVRVPAKNTQQNNGIAWVESPTVGSYVIVVSQAERLVCQWMKGSCVAVGKAPSPMSAIT